jgi:hypothetical protein
VFADGVAARHLRGGGSVPVVATCQSGATVRGLGLDRIVASAVQLAYVIQFGCAIARAVQLGIAAR